MALRIALCSDIDLESRFKHMTTKKWLEYEEDQLTDFEQLIKTVIKQKVDAFFSLRSEFDRLTEKSQETKQLIEVKSNEREKLEEIDRDLKKYQKLMKEHDSIKSKIQIESKGLENFRNTLNSQIKEYNEHKRPF